mmetsp:Transcript_12082/g.35247  ORF Transcript_12082/g.35247 Transcript_12082/m.35247 type:complete len:285 (+) Transcript_12082:984-1838(+)
MRWRRRTSEGRSFASSRLPSRLSILSVASTVRRSGTRREGEDRRSRCRRIVRTDGGTRGGRAGGGWADTDTTTGGRAWRGRWDDGGEVSSFRRRGGDAAASFSLLPPRRRGTRSRGGGGGIAGRLLALSSTSTILRRRTRPCGRADTPWSRSVAVNRSGRDLATAELNHRHRRRHPPPPRRRRRRRPGRTSSPAFRNCRTARRGGCVPTRRDRDRPTPTRPGRRRGEVEGRGGTPPPSPNRDTRSGGPSNCGHMCGGGRGGSRLLPPPTGMPSEGGPSDRRHRR